MTMNPNPVKVIFLAIFSFFAFSSAPVHAKYEYKFDQHLYPYGQYESETATKLTRGLTNVLYGWTEIFQTPIHMSENPSSHMITGILLGVPYGILRFVGRTVVGAYEVVTCFVPQKPIFSALGGDVV